MVDHVAWATVFLWRFARAAEAWVMFSIKAVLSRVPMLGLGRRSLASDWPSSVILHGFLRVEMGLPDSVVIPFSPRAPRPAPPRPRVAVARGLGPAGELASDSPFISNSFFNALRYNTPADPMV